MTRDPLREQIDYYRARAGEYDEWFYRQGRFDHGSLSNGQWYAEVNEIFQVQDGLDLTGNVLELASGTGIWTERLCRTAHSVTAVDASEEMIAVNRAKLGAAAGRVEYVHADLFTWRPVQLYDAVVFAFWISHVPLEQLDRFILSVIAALRPGGLVFFVDSKRDPDSTAKDHGFPETGSELMTRTLNDGRSYLVVKNFWSAAFLESRFAAAGIYLEVRETERFFIFGMGHRLRETVAGNLEGR